MLNADEVHRQKRERASYLLGVMGYAGRFRARPDDSVADFKRDATRLLKEQFEASRDRHGASLVVVSGATDAGVLHLTYALCAQLHISAAGITSDAALRYQLGAMDWVAPVGARFGDESELFVACCDEFLVLGGGAQSLHEAELAAAMGKPVTAVRGFGGAADDLTEERVPTMRAVLRRPPKSVD